MVAEMKEFVVHFRVSAAILEKVLAGTMSFLRVCVAESFLEKTLQTALSYL